MKLENNYHSLTNSVFDNVILILKSMLVGVCAGGIAVRKSSLDLVVDSRLWNRCVFDRKNGGLQPYDFR